jgi:oxygen-independent coproporphyrinogen-3 oxidase
MPWCVRKCPYCDFNSHEARVIPQQDYIASLVHDLREDLTHYDIDRDLHSIFIGGGTPSLFSASVINQLLTEIDQHWPIANDIEITMEINPGTVEHDNFADYRAAGINRLSLGIQSFSNQQLKNLGRIHSAEEAIDAINTVRESGFENYNLDLMFGLPEQSLQEGLADLQQAIALKPAHISWYQLTLEPNTVFYKKPPILPDMDMIADLHEQGQQLLTEAGYAQYEISAYATTDKHCIHNVNYWNFGDYLGIGAGAHGKITTNNGAVIRTRKVTMPNTYLARKTQSFTAKAHTIAPEALPFEYFLNRLRLNTPINIDNIPEHIGLDFLDKHSAIHTAIDKNFLYQEKNILQKTELGQRFLNDLLSLFL